MKILQYVGAPGTAALVCLLSLPAPLAGAERDHIVVDRSDVLEAMRRHYGDFELTSTTNGAWMAEVLFDLARQARERDPGGMPLFIGHEDWFRSFLAVTGRTEDSVPQYALLNHRYRQNMEVDYRADRTIRAVKEGPVPELAVNLRSSWEAGPGRPDRYSYIDTLSTPTVKVTNRQVITYRLLDYGDWVVYDEIEGITARPQSGVLALLFRLIGEGRIAHSRIAVARDGVQVSRTRAEKAFMKVTTTVTIYPDGSIEKGVPDGRSDLLELERLLKQPLDLDYVRFPGDW